MSDPEPYLLVEKCGASRGKPIYVITKHIPLVGVSSPNPACLFYSHFLLISATDTYPSRTREIRCMDLGGEALGTFKAKQGGCTQIQFFNEASGHLQCTNPECGMEFSKASLQDNAYIQIQGLPA
ncbi:hypothetical protein L210DRAFT_2830466 [Boletus edulis BED1]|uniref:Uncharacterized protein n=1 Tax=Boletus edulis BED1 TaxID=1328754 RepID=A0AAD4C5B3_BOLED|nr:hypothetical protein L210DRAFT_2830466 [Boletus edulis BED1]